MNKKEILELLRSIEKGKTTAEEALSAFKVMPFEDLGYAKVDHHRAMRQGVKEVIFGKSKTSEQIYGIASAMLDKGCKDILITRTNKDAVEYLKKHYPIKYDEISGICIVNPDENRKQVGSIVIASAGTSDMSVSEEAAITAEVLGNKVTRLYDVGVSGLHRLLSKLDIITSARVVVTVAGMEGALASVIGGLVDCPVVAVPTSIGYGANFGGLSALLSMLNSCSSGVSVVNIDNGFGAGYLASMINQMEGIN